MQAMLHFIYRDTLPDLEEHVDLGEIFDPSPCFLTPETMIEYLLTAADRSNDLPPINPKLPFSHPSNLWPPCLEARPAYSHLL